MPLFGTDPEIVKRHWRVLAAYVVIGTALYWAALGAFLVSDDFEFLTIVASAKSWLVIFEPLVGRFVRPFVVLMYYVCYRLFGLAPWSYHVAALLPHLVSAFLVYLLGLRLFGGPERSALQNEAGSEGPGLQQPHVRFLAFLAGLLFLVFSGHSEAVAWPAGIADPIVAVALLISFLYYLRACEPGAAARYVAFSYVAVLAAVLTKEVWVTYPGILLAHAVLLGNRDPQARRRAAILVVATGATVLVYFVMRQAVFGSVTGGYSGLGTSFGTDMWLKEVRAFVLRCFVPAGLWEVGLWKRLDLVIWPAVALVVLLRVRGRWGRVVLFTAAAMMLALLPVLPLTISASTTESERLTYVATVFSCLLVVAAAEAVFRNRVLVAAACAPLLIWHAAVLVQNTIRWREAGQMARGIVDTFASNVRQHDPGRNQPIFVLNLPDNLHGAYVYRHGFYAAIQLYAPDVADSTARSTGIATNAFAGLHDRVTVRQTARNRFVLDVGANRIIQPEIPSGWAFRILSQHPAGYEVQIADTLPSAVVMATSGGLVEYVGTSTSPGLPFGAFDLPVDGTTCEGPTLRLAGWALDNAGVARITIDRIGEDGTWEPLGEGTWFSGTRPDVAATFRALPNSDRAEWNYLLPCAAVAAARGGEMRVRVTAIDTDGQRAELGARLVKAGHSKP